MKFLKYKIRKITDIILIHSLIEGKLENIVVQHMFLVQKFV